MIGKYFIVEKVCKAWGEGGVGGLLAEAEKMLKVTDRYVVTYYALKTDYHRVFAELAHPSGVPLTGTFRTYHPYPFVAMDMRVTPRGMVPDRCLLLYRYQRRWNGKWRTFAFLHAIVTVGEGGEQ